MKKTISLVLVFCLALSLVFAEANDQKIYNVDSTIYQNIVKLYLATGHAMPSTTGPWSGNELAKMLTKIDKNSIPTYLTETYNTVAQELNVQPSLSFEGGGMELDGTIMN